jgi:hypothetical protein
MVDWNVVFSRGGRNGTVTYTEGVNVVRFEWELGGGDTVAIISGPSRQAWEAELPWASNRRREIIGRVAQEAIRLQAPGSHPEFTDDETTIVLRTAP